MARPSAPRKHVKCCCCGRIVPPGRDELRLTPQQWQIYDAVIAKAVCVEDLRKILWGRLADRISEKHVHVQVFGANRKLRAHGLRIISVDRLYYLVDYGNAKLERPRHIDTGRLDEWTQPARQTRFDRGQ